MERWKTECIIYDCDGVLFDSLEVNRMLYNRIARAGGRGVLTTEEVLYCHAHTVNESIHHIFGTDEEGEAKGTGFWRNEIDLKELVTHLKMEPNLLETLAELKNRGMALAICTNRTTTMPSIVELFGLARYFDMVVTALDVKNPKPHPESVEMILEALHVEKERTLYVGDSEVDVKTARSSGVKIIAYKNRALEADGFIEDHLEVLGLLLNG